MDNIERDIRSANSGIKIVSCSVIEIQSILKSKLEIDCDYKVTEISGSPLRPTEYGASLIKKSGLEKIIDENKTQYIKRIKELLSPVYSEYDIQEKARNVLMKDLKKPIMKPLRDYAYKEGWSEDLLESVVKTAGLWLRDDFLGNKREVNKIKDNE